MSQPARSPYLVGPVFDWALFLLPPALSLLVGVLISHTSFTDDALEVGGEAVTWSGLVIGAIIHAHLVAVFFRSHGNRDIYRLYRVRFVVVPLVLWGLIVASEWLAVTAAVVATFWDVWHSGAQTFGFGRIYDRNAGVITDAGRRLDFWLNQLLYAGPILGGVTLIDHVAQLEEYESVGTTFFTAVPAHAEAAHRTLAWIVLVAGGLFLACYLYFQLQLARRGHRPSRLKVFLYVTTGACSIYTWGWNSWGEAFFIMNLFHAVQYLGLVWAMEHRRWCGWLAKEGRPAGKPLVAALFLGSVLAYGWGVQLVDPDLTALWAVTIVVSLMHFWYDGFVWSVRRKQV
ncbi:MAG TPA: hypothetical protein VMZ28_25780 [Kofleriaceae bacterium]|nr:hypothetical protein [Kofleriaceae bacterium]